MGISLFPLSQDFILNVYVLFPTQRRPTNNFPGSVFRLITLFCTSSMKGKVFAAGGKLREVSKIKCLASRNEKRETAWGKLWKQLQLPRLFKSFNSNSIQLLECQFGFRLVGHHFTHLTRKPVGRQAKLSHNT